MGRCHGGNGYTVVTGWLALAPLPYIRAVHASATYNIQYDSLFFPPVIQWIAGRTYIDPTSGLWERTLNRRAGIICYFMNVQPHCE